MTATTASSSSVKPLRVERCARTGQERDNVSPLEGCPCGRHVRLLQAGNNQRKNTGDHRITVRRDSTLRDTKRGVAVNKRDCSQ